MMTLYNDLDRVKKGAEETGMIQNTPEFMIRFIEPEDWRALVEIWSDFKQSPYARYDVPHSLDVEEVKEKARRWAEVSPHMEHMFFAVCNEDGMFGYIDFHKIEGGYECGYCFHSRYHGRGYARESLRRLMEWLAKDGRKRFVAGTAFNNLPSVRLLDSLGFQKVGEEKVSFYKDEKGEDIYFDGGIFMVCVGE